MDEEPELIPKETENLKDYLGYSAPLPEEKHNVHSFLNKIATADDTTKVGFLKDEEVGVPQFNVRALKELSLISNKIIENDLFKEYFEDKSEIITSTSLSRGGFLAKLAVLQKRESIISDTNDRMLRKENKGWFKPKSKQPEGLTSTQ